jgi:DNA-binding NtrC family response regulator
VTPRTDFVFDRQRIVVAGDDSAIVAFTIATLRRDGHCVTHVADAKSASWDVALRDCHLLIVGSGIAGTVRTDLLDELRAGLPGLALLCLTDASCTPSSAAATLREPFTAEELQAAVRPLLPQLRIGSVLARKAPKASPG